MAGSRTRAQAPEAGWVDSDTAFAELCERLASEPVWAFDTEFHRERTYYPRLALLQVAWRGGVALVDPLAVDVGPLADVLGRPSTVVAHAAEQDLEVLDRACGRGPARLLDTQICAGFLGMSSPGLGNLLDRELKVKLPKTDRLSDWSRRPLTAGQLDYAVADVVHLLPLHDRLVEALQARGRLAWAEEECARLLAKPRGPVEPDTAWWRLKDARALRGESRGVAQEVAAWRERRAAALDLPPRYVLADLAVLGIAHRPPRQATDLEGIRGVDVRSLKPPVVAELLEAVERGRALPADRLRVPETEHNAPDQRAAISLATSWIAQLGRDEDIDPALLATRAEVTALLNGRPAGRLDEGWRKRLVGDPVRFLAAGKAAIAFDGNGGLVLEERSHRPL